MNSQYELELLSKLVEIDTNAQTKTGYVACSEVIRTEAEKLGLKVRVYDSVKLASDKMNRPNLVIDLDVDDSERIIFSTHYDVVPAGQGWIHEPFKLTIEGNRAYGRGASDNKAGIAAALGALRELKTKGNSQVNVSLLVSPDEEVGGELGVGYLVEKVKIRADGAIILDSGPDVVSIGASGAVWGKVIVRGLQGHAGYPHLAKNAIQLALPLLNDLARYAKIREKVRSRLPAPPTAPKKTVWGRFSITMLRAGEKENVIPGECEARFDLRVCPDEDNEKAKQALINYFEKIREKHKCDAQLEFMSKRVSNYYTDPKHPLVKALSLAVKQVVGKVPIAADLGGNDGHYFARAGIPVVSYGPIRNDCNVHGKDEFVYINDLDLVKRVLIQLCTNWTHLTK
jgi:succinyl-diaminopimelate desuccinylase